MKNKVTVKDVAREAGVSVATVSYIMNDRKDVKISDATRKKVLQVANLMNYRPSSAAKSLATGKSNILGITYRFNKETPSRNMELSFYINLLVEQLNRMGYDVIFIPVDPVSENSTLKHNIDGIIAIDLSNEDFNNFSNNYMVPIVAVDMLVNDALFYQVYSNLPNAINAALSRHSDAVLVMESYLNEAYMDYITGEINPARIYIVKNANADTLVSLRGKKTIVIGTYLALLLRPYVAEENMIVISSNAFSHMLPENAIHLENDASKKANLAINLLLNAIDRKFVVNHKYEINVELNPAIV